MSRFAYRNCPWLRSRICPRADKVRGMTLGHNVGIKSTASADPISRLNIVRQQMDRRRIRADTEERAFAFAARAMPARQVRSE